ncbi:MAG TPA: sulfur carrier protein ThiS [Gammaproteobacteria bacterium]|nr:sulfur carrier protein ThiS [Gammaproteobacteria bacterium]
MQLTVNGRPVETPEDCVLQTLLQRLAVSGRFAVEVNAEIIPRSSHADHRLRPGDRIEIVHAVGGG